MNKELYDKCCTYDFKSLFESKGYSFFTKGTYNLNIIGIRSNNNDKVTNSFDDLIIVDYNTAISHKRNVYHITTEPGLYYMNNPINIRGAAILAPGQYKGCFAIGKHRGKYEALCQVKPVTVYRDDNKDSVYDCNPRILDNGLFGINIHRSTKDFTSKKIDRFSAGCQVFADPNDFRAFMSVCKKQKEIYGNSFTYTLLKEDELV